MSGKRRLSIATTPAVIFVNVGYAVGHRLKRLRPAHLGVVPELGGLIAATLLANMFTGPIIVLAA